MSAAYSGTRSSWPPPDKKKRGPRMDSGAQSGQDGEIDDEADAADDSKKKELPQGDRNVLQKH
jgi:hypothetical protein